MATDAGFQPNRRVATIQSTEHSSSFAVRRHERNVTIETNGSTEIASGFNDAPAAYEFALSMNRAPSNKRIPNQIVAPDGH